MTFKSLLPVAAGLGAAIVPGPFKIPLLAVGALAAISNAGTTTTFENEALDANLIPDEFDVDARILLPKPVEVIDSGKLASVGSDLGVIDHPGVPTSTRFRNLSPKSIRFRPTYKLTTNNGFKATTQGATIELPPADLEANKAAIVIQDGNVPVDFPTGTDGVVATLEVLIPTTSGSLVYWAVGGLRIR